MPDFGDVNPDTGRTNRRTEYSGTYDPNAPSVANGQITPEQWARYQSRRRRDAILGTLLTLGGATAGGYLSQALSGAGAGAAATGASGSLPPIAGGAPWAVTPYAAPAAMSPTGAALVGGTVGAGAIGAGGGAAAGAGVGAAGGAAGSAAAEAARTFGGLTMSDWLALGGTGVSALGSMNSGNQPNFDPNTSTTDPNLQRLIESMQRRLDKAEPLYDSVLAMSNGLLPTRYQR